MAQAIPAILGIVQAGATVYAAKQQSKAFGSQSAPSITTAAPPPPATESASQVNKAREDALIKAQRRKGFATTISAGETGGYGSSTKLGGGG